MTGFGVGLVALVNARQPLSISAAGDRSTLFRVESDGRVYNDYTVRIENRGMYHDSFHLECRVVGVSEGNCMVHHEDNPLPLQSREETSFKMAISTNGASMRPGPNRLELTATAAEQESVEAVAEIAFFMPEDSTALGGR